jgi:glycosyltransferase involved in cell wall biosynthesis
MNIANTVPMIKTKDCIITPVRDEEAFIGKTFESVLAQTILPCEWIIVDDGSTDRTPFIIDDFARKHSWITALHRKDIGFRSTGGGIAGFLFGLENLRTRDWNFLVNLDGDLSFAPNYFEKCFHHFASNPKLGIAGGTIYNKIEDKLVLERVAEFHVRGATKVYRRECWDRLGGMWNGLGWDTIDEVKANIRGWETRSIPDLPLVHYRFTGSGFGKWWGLIKNGQADYIVGYHPVFFGAKCIRRLFRAPVLLGSLALAYGWINAHWKRLSRVEDPEIVAFVRSQQLKRLLGQSSIWK